MACSCQSGSSPNASYQVVKNGVVIGAYKTLVEATAAAARQGGAVKNA